MADRNAQLKRIAAAAPPPRVRIYELREGVSGRSWPYWLCDRHLAKKKLNGYTVEGSRDPAHEIACDDRHLYPCGQEMAP